MYVALFPYFCKEKCIFKFCRYEIKRSQKVTVTLVKFEYATVLIECNGKNVEYKRSSFVVV